ncbi:hypothetical protein [Actinopolyspora mortivallis]|uniref:Uncharacterized protein n=1 Tax=Actinopolyspora mortivallis TaxID=33906 RepID=A0A2T0GZF6_ACTMO|nr:hypothetical protein [Actinopolyspora mortivallis]PRW64470.1 hypothetical protein CEP50_05455 [Actinopolyspora mortivallis]
MRPGGAARVVAAVVCLGMVVGYASTHLLVSGVSGWVVLFVALLVLGLPLGAVLRSATRSRRR